MARFRGAGSACRDSAAIKFKEVIVANDSKGKVIGFIHGIVHNDPISSGPLLSITAFYVREAFRDKGIECLA